jgi:arylsulfatase A-like enzyme
MKKSIALASGVLSAVGLGSCTEKSDDSQPNIIFIYADDLGYGDLGCYGSPVNRTPHLDQMAKDGIRFTDFYSAAANSSPSRAALLTGRYPIRMGINDVFHPPSFTGIPASEIKMSEVLRDQGYRTGIIGKWHLGHMHQFLPLQNGFDEYFGIPYSNDMASCFYLRGNEVESFSVNQDSITYNYTQEALRFIENHKDRPFFLYIPHNMPHVPIAASANFRGKSANGLYGDTIEELDWSVGEILKKLDELGLDKNTIVVFSSDNGPWLTEGPNGGVAVPLFQGKNTCWEGGQRVPTIIRWKDKIRGGQVINDLAAMIDWFPTFVKLAGGTVPTDRIIDGCDLAPVLFGDGKRENNDFAYIHFRRFQGFRSGDWKIKLPAAMQRGNFWVEDVPAHDTLFFNLRNDISETINIKDEYPNEYQATLARMNAFMGTLEDCPPPIVLTENRATMLNSRQRTEAINEAREKGILPKSETGIR